MTNFSKNIRYLRKRKGWSQDYIAEQLGYKSYTTIQKWEMGTSEPPLKKSKQLADLFGVDIDDITNKDLENISHTPTKSIKKGVTINVLGKVAAGIPFDAVEYILDTEEIPIQLAKTGEFFGLRIKGDSMSPRISEGDTVIVKRQDDAESGDIVIVLINGDCATCKRLIKYEDGISLVSFNPLYEPMTFNNKEIAEKPVKIIGRVVENRQKY